LTALLMAVGAGMTTVTFIRLLAQLSQSSGGDSGNGRYTWNDYTKGLEQLFYVGPSKPWDPLGGLEDYNRWWVKKLTGGN